RDRERGPLRRGVARAGAAVRPVRARRPARRARLPRVPRRSVVSTYTSLTDDDLRVMLAAIGAGSVEELFAGMVPEGVRLDRPLHLPQGMSEQEVFAHL